MTLVQQRHVFRRHRDGGLLGLMTIGNQATDQIDQKIGRATMARVLDLGDVLQLIIG
jgi:uncharacterized protein YejL (UPF0352 family)